MITSEVFPEHCSSSPLRLLKGENTYDTLISPLLQITYQISNPDSSKCATFVNPDFYFYNSNVLQVRPLRISFKIHAHLIIRFYIYLDGSNCNWFQYLPSVLLHNVSTLKLCFCFVSQFPGVYFQYQRHIGVNGHGATCLANKPLADWGRPKSNSGFLAVSANIPQPCPMALSPWPVCFHCG